MRKTLNVAAVVCGVLFALVVIREAFFSYTAYFVIVPSVKIYADGKPTSGWFTKAAKGVPISLPEVAADGVNLIGSPHRVTSSAV